jgi:riboflavin biosynthesis pyrimidine reductase
MLLPGTAEVGDLAADRDSTLQALADLYAYPEGLGSRAWVRATMVSTLDGAASGGDGRSGSISAPTDVAVFGVLRALADVVLVGAGTVRAEGYGPVQPPKDFADRRAAGGQAVAAHLAVVTRSGFVPGDTGLFKGDVPTYVVTTAGADLDRLRSLAGAEHVIVAGDAEVDVADAVHALAARGLRRVLLEGGPTLLGAGLAAGRVDELCLTWSPLLAGGDGPRIAVGPPVRLAARPAHLLAADGLLLGRWLVQRPQEPASSQP